MTTKPAVRPESEWPKNSYSCRSICLVAHTVPRQSRLLPGAKDQTVSHRQYHAVYAGAAVTRFRMAGCAGECDAEDLHRLASCRFSPVLALEVTTGRPRIPAELRALIRALARDNPSWGEERIANVLLLKLGIRISPRTVRKYMAKRSRGQPRGDQRWSTFVRNHASAILACDFCVVVTAAFRLLYVIIVIEHQTRRIVHCNGQPTPQPRGHCSNCEKPYPRTIVTVFSSMTAMALSHLNSTNLLHTWDCVYSKRHREVPRLTASASGSSVRSAEYVSTFLFR